MEREAKSSKNPNIMVVFRDKKQVQSYDTTERFKTKMVIKNCRSNSTINHGLECQLVILKNYICNFGTWGITPRIA